MVANDNDAIIQESSTPDVSLATSAAAGLKDPLRASAPAGATSALDKAMSFLNKYKQGASNAATATGTKSSRKSLDVANATFDEDEIDMSLSSDSDRAGRNPGRAAASTLKASQNEPGLEPTATERDFYSKSLTLSGMRSSRRFGTAKELGISGSGGLNGPKAAVSPVGINGRPTNRGEGGERHQADACSPSEHQSSGLHLVVNIPGESSTYGSPVRRESESDIESVGSTVAEALEEQSLGGDEVSDAEPWVGSLNSELAVSSEVDAEGSAGLVSPVFEHQSGQARNLNKGRRGANGRRVARSPPDRGALGKVMSVDNLSSVSRPQTSPNPRYRGTNAEDASRGESSEIIGGSYATEGAHRGDDDDDDEEEDDYGDDEFEDQDVLMESIGETAPVTNGHNTNSAPTREARSHVSRVGQLTLPAGGTVNNQDRERPLEAWSMPPADNEEARSLPGTPDSGTSPRPFVNGDIDPEDGRAPSGSREAWVERSAGGPCAKGAESNAPGVAGGVARPPFTNTHHCQQQRDKSIREIGEEDSGGVSLSKSGVMIDRSTEASNPIRPPDTEVKVITRVQAVASVEYAHDPESGLNLRSCGTQVWKRPEPPFFQ